MSQTQDRSMHAVCAMLSDRQRRLLVYLTIRRRAVEEAAQELGLTPEEARAELARAGSLLRGMLHLG